MTFLIIAAALIATVFALRWSSNQGALPHVGMLAGATIALYILIAWALRDTGPGGSMAAVFAPAAVYFINKYWRGSGDNSGHVRGNSLASAKAVQKMVAKEPSRFKIGEIQIPVSAETRHFLLCGATGSGKSQTFHQILGPVRESGQRAVVADVGGEFVARYWRDGDVSLNPFDVRGVSWSPLAELRGAWDADKIAKSIVPDVDGPAGEWNGYAQTITGAVLLRLWESGEGNNAELLRLLTMAPAAELKEFVSGLPAEGMFAEGSEKMLASIMGVISSSIKPLAHLDPTAGAGAFSIRNWMQNESGAWLFLNFTDGQFTTLKPLIAASLDIAISELLELKPNQDRRVFFAIDEFATFGRIGAIDPLLTKGRARGGCAVLGMQAISQIRSAYGRDTAQTLLANLGTWLVLRCSDPETAEYMSTYIGDEEIRRVVVSENVQGMSMANNFSGGRSQNTSEELRTQRVVLASELQNLQDRVGLLNIVGAIPPCVVGIPIVAGEEVAERFIPRPRGNKRLITAETAVETAPAPTVAEAA